MSKAISLAFVLGLIVMGLIVYSAEAAVNRAPFFISPNFTETHTNVGQLLEFSVFASDPDYDIVTYSAFNLPSGATFHVDNRTFSWQPSTNQVGTYNVTFRAFDDLATTDKLVRIVVDGQNIGGIPSNTSTTNNPSTSGPVFVNFNPPVSVKEGQLYIYTPQVVSQRNPVVFRLLSGPTGLTINPNLGTILWVPNFNQGRAEPYPVAIAISDGYWESTRDFSIYVTDTNFTLAPVSPSTGTNTVIVEKEVPEKLKIYNVRVTSEKNGDVLISWETNKPATSRIIYDNFSQGEKSVDFTYANATPEDIYLIIVHSINLGSLQLNTPYYFRAVSKANDEIAISNERILVQLPDGSLNDLSLTAFFGAVGGFFVGHPFLVFLMLAAAALLWVLYRRSKN